MIVKLLESVFEKVGAVTGNESDNGRASNLEYELRENYGVSISAKSLVRYLKGENSPGLEVRNALAKYLEFENYEDYVRKSVNKNNLESKEKGSSIPKNEEPKRKSKPKNVLIAFATLIAGNLAYIGFTNGEECMLWKDSYFEECECTGQALEFEMNETELEKFRKKEVCDTTTFFKKYEPVIWYDKYNGKIEFFTYYGKNPINGRTLKPITQTIINKHVKSCDDL